MRIALPFQGSLGRRPLALWLGNVALSCALLLLTACTHKPQVLIHSQQGQVVVPVEIAATSQARSQGLMYRKDLAADAGMLFLFPQEMEQSFWMKNTPLPLDMIFISSDLRIAGIVAKATPFSTEPRSVGKPSRYVLEVHGGFCDQHGIRAGDRVELQNLEGQAAH